ncbi:hypothetical protein LNKW23_28930 [Paralimibaculum aggregatum]|uniref:DUF4214 domain-containing protein n=1 Tax=Paralimibaculum aggregatum TaxID=3036245 RepID=A0ABQ6LRF8_9RHOB|nr:DUF4214 domain-containing protein [Limibaculum sp. NKW23]GMG83680.1 hypothetical protein LNKW23_28930 [Limibaculum sp. NKW23]
MDYVFKGDVQFWQRTSETTSFFIQVATWRITTPVLTIAYGDLPDMPEIEVQNLTLDVLEDPDFVEAFQVVDQDGLDTVVLVAGQEPLTDNGTPLPQREFFIDFGPMMLPVPDVGTQFTEVQELFTITPLTYDLDTEEPVDGPFGAGMELDFRDVDAFEFLGQVGETLLAGSEAERQDRAELIALIYEAALDRNGDVDEGGLNFWIDRAAEGLTDVQLANAFTASPEFVAAFGAPGSLSDEAYVERLYRNVLDRPSDEPGFAFWSEALDLLGGNRDLLLLAFARSNENRVNSDFVETLEETDPGIWEFGLA